jgi:anti-anti-sigma factor
MNILVTQAKTSRSPVTIMRVVGDIDGSNYTDLISEAEQAVNNGTLHILLDLTEVSYMSTAGMVALQTISRLLRGEHGSMEGWAAIKDVPEGAGAQAHLKLLNPGKRIKSSLEALGLTKFFPIFTDEKKALASF